ncbi:MAG: hypothetical protein II823_06715 [Kiritimatiellae bacterium]|nr:hypothetical protein [Kiritimatiellia bacterium]
MKPNKLIDLSKDVATSRHEFAEGKGIPHEQIVRDTRKMLLRWIEADKCRSVRKAVSR